MVNRKKVKKSKNVLKALGIFLLIILLGIILSILHVQTDGKKRIVSMDNLPKKVDTIIVLGSGGDSLGSPSDILIDRLDTALEVYNHGVQGKFLFSGDYGKEGYNEVGSMKSYVIRNDSIKEQDIFLDQASFSTYESIYRLKEIFKVNKAIIITNEYQLPRALYIASKLGVEAYGVTSDKRDYVDIEIYKKRELLYQFKDFIYTNIIKPEPTYLGDSIPVNSSDGIITDDSIKDM